MPRKGYKQTEEHKEKNRFVHLKKNLSDETIRKMSEARLGKIPWHKGKTGVYSDETLEKMRIAKLKIWQDENYKQNMKKIHLKENLSEETLQKMREIHLYKHTSPQTEFKKNHIPWNKGKTGIYSEETIGKLREIAKKRFGNKKIHPMYGKHHNRKTRLEMSKVKTGYIPWNKGIKCPQFSGDKHPNWQGGRTSLTIKIRGSFEYRQWRSDIFMRDNFVCQECGQISGNLNAHHIRPFSSIIQYYEITTIEEALNCEALWNINNGITLCEKCHKKIKSSRNKNLVN